MGYTYTMGYHSALKRKAILTQATALDEPEDMLSEKIKITGFHLREVLGVVKITEMRQKVERGLSGGGESGEWESVCGHRVSVL